MLRAALRLVAAQAREPGRDAEFGQRAPHRLGLAQVVVALDALDALLPEPAVARLEPGRRHLRLVDLEVELEPHGQVVDETIRLREEITGVDQDHRQTPAPACVTMCSDTAACAPKLDDNACLPGRFSSAHATRSSAVICSRSAFISSTSRRLFASPIRIPGHGSHAFTAFALRRRRAHDSCAPDEITETLSFCDVALRGVAGKQRHRAP